MTAVLLQNNVYKILTYRVQDLIKDDEMTILKKVILQLQSAAKDTLSHHTFLIKFVWTFQFPNT